MNAYSLSSSLAILALSNTNNQQQWHASRHAILLTAVFFSRKPSVTCHSYGCGTLTPKKSISVLPSSNRLSVCLSVRFNAHKKVPKAFRSYVIIMTNNTSFKNSCKLLQYYIFFMQDLKFVTGDILHI